MVNFQISALLVEMIVEGEVGVALEGAVVLLMAAEMVTCRETEMITGQLEKLRKIYPWMKSLWENLKDLWDLNGLRMRNLEIS